MKRHIVATLALFALVVAAGDTGVSQTGFQFQPGTRTRLARMIQQEPDACVDLIEQAESIEELRQALVDRVSTQYRATKILEAARALRHLDLPEETTLGEILEAAAAITMEAGER